MPSPVPTPHDQFFRAVLGQPPLAADFLRHYLPAGVARHLDLDTLTLRPGSFVDDDLRAHHGDLLYEVRLEGGGSSLIYVLFEHKSRPDRLVGFQLLRYIVRIWERDLREHGARGRAARDRGTSPAGTASPRLRPILPLVLYQGARRWTAPRSLGALYDGPPPLQPYWPELRYALVDLGAIPEADIAGQAALRVALLVMRAILDPDLGRRLPELLEPLRHHPTPLGMLQVVMQYIVQANDRVTRDDVAAALEAVDANEGGTDMPTLAQQWVEEGVAEGLHAAIADALDVRFGAEARGLADDVRTVIDPQALRAILRAVMRAATVEEARRVVTSR